MSEVTISEPALLIRIPKLWTATMSRQALYEATRGVWKIGERREEARFALSIADGIVREVFAIVQWHPAGTTEYQTRPRKDIEVEGRWEFTGAVAPEDVRSKYIDKSVSHYFQRGNSNPILYVNV